MKNLLLIVLGISYLKAGVAYEYTKEDASGWLTSISMVCSEQATRELIDQGDDLKGEEYEEWNENFEANKATLTKDCEYSALFNMFYYLVQTKRQAIKNYEETWVQNVNSSNIDNFLAAVKLKGMFGGESFDFWKDKLSKLDALVSDNLDRGIVKDVSGHEIIN